MMAVQHLSYVSATGAIYGVVPPAPTVLYPTVGCQNAACPCVDHREPDLNILTTYGFSIVTRQIGRARLTPNEMRLLAILLPPGRLVTYAEILRRVWSEPPATRDADLHRMRVACARLREKLPPRWELLTQERIGLMLLDTQP